MSEDKDDKQFEPSEEKLRKARQQGDAPRSTELNAAAMYLGAWLAFAIAGGFAVKAWLTMATRSMGSDGWPLNSAFSIAGAIGKFTSLTAFGIILLPSVAILLGLIGQRGLTFSTKKLTPDINRINPIKNAGQKFGPGGLVTFAISLGKATLVCFGGYMLFRALFGLIANSTISGERQWIPVIGLLLQRVLMLAIAASVVFAVFDVLWKWYDHRRKNRMTRKEVEDEHKDSEGDPHMKSARRQKAIDIVMSQMLSDVETADVIIVNPTHYAVALKWQRGSGRAPVCVAKGVDEVAARIRARATDHDVPIWSDPPCARAIHATVQIGDEIQRDHFAPVAAAIRFAEKMRARARAGW